MEEVLISRQQIKDKIFELAKQIKLDYQDKKLFLVGILDGSYILMADLSRMLFEQGFSNFEINFIGVSSYANSRESSKNPKITKDLNLDILDKHVLLVEDIVDTGWSLDFVQRLLNERKPASLKTLVLLSKPDRREVKVKLDYLGFEIENKWVEGYGLDTAGLGRGNPDVIQKK
ncbi:hypoxanthine phosphoribosyltransferase [Candidatus Daviesbacteria bacterium]|nr:hypoxanthine phosphoribosyltransferase [Candidatus Daviesbacteria bacterium]